METISQLNQVINKNNSVIYLLQLCANYLMSEVCKPNIFLVPARVFLGIGWLRAAIEKGASGTWFTGVGVEMFLLEHLPTMTFPFFQSLAINIFLPQAEAFAFVVFLAQVLVGLSLIFGVFTKPALLGGMLMNISFLLAGAVNPSTFYLVIQMLLFSMNAGEVLSLDALKRQPASKPLIHRHKRIFLVCAFSSLILASLAFPYIQDFSPKGAIEDVAAVTVVLLSMLSSFFAITYLRLNQNISNLIA